MVISRRNLLALMISVGVAKPALAARAPVDMIVVFKGSRRLYLYHNGQPFKSYPIGLGWAPEGDKAFEGDGRTPEGSYYIDRRNPQSNYYLSLGISYPDRNQLAAARAADIDPGGDIFIHGGLGKRRQKGDWTAGCIAVSDQNIEEIWDLVPNGALIVIQP